jgi:DNA-binding MarR family transcriptional regulator
MTAETLVLARRTLEIVPSVMRIIGMEMRRSGHTLPPAHFRLLGMLANCPCNLSELARRQGVSLPTMSDSITLLVDRGLAQRGPDARDRRIVHVELTESGRHALDEMQSLVEIRIAELMDGLSPDQVIRLAAGLEALHQVIQSANSPSTFKGKEDADAVAC